MYVERALFLRGGFADVGIYAWLTENQLLLVSGTSFGLYLGSFKPQFTGRLGQ